MKLQPKWCAAALAVLLAAVSVPSDGLLKADSANLTVYINEICTQNQSVLTDSYGAYSDWIELYNAGSVPVDLSGYGLSDKVDEPLQ